MSKEAMKLALEALENVWSNGLEELTTAPMECLRQAIAEAEKQEPYCWTWDEFVSGGKWRAEYGWQKPTSKVTNLQALYTSPPQRQPLTDEQIDSATRKQSDDLLDHIYEYGTAAEGVNYRIRAIARAIEAAHGIKENT